MLKLHNTFIRASAVRRFAVVEFTEEDGLAVVPGKWISKDEKKCYWPPYKSATKIQLAVKGCVTPTEDYTPHDVRVLYDTGNISIIIIYFFPHN